MGIISIILEVIISLSLLFLQAPFSVENNVNIYSLNSHNLNLYYKVDNNSLNDISADKIKIIGNNDVSYLEQREEEKQAIASITKLMTALVFLDNEPNLNEVYTISEDDTIDGGKRHFFIGEKIKLSDILKAALIASDNEAAAILSQVNGLEKDEFIKLMNKKAIELGMLNTQFVDSTGLNKGNISTASDVSILFKEAFNNELIKEALSIPEYSFETLQGREKKITSTDYSVFNENINYLGGKTGYTDEADYCLVSSFRVSEEEDIIVVVLNSDSKEGRFSESMELTQIIRDKYYK